MCSLALLGNGQNDISICIAPMSAEAFGSIENPTPIFPGGSSLGTRRIAARSRFGQGPGPERLTTGQRSQVLLLLLLGSQEIDVIGTQGVMRGYREGDGSIHTSKLFNDDNVFGVSQTRSPILGADDRPHHAQFAQLFDHIEGKMLLLIPLQTVGGNFIESKVANRLSQNLMLRSVAKFHNAILHEFLDLCESAVAGTGPQAKACGSAGDNERSQSRGL